jgi:hypothetical protein
LPGLNGECLSFRDRSEYESVGTQRQV